MRQENRNRYADKGKLFSKMGLFVTDCPKMQLDVTPKGVLRYTCRKRRGPERNAGAFADGKTRSAENRKEETGEKGRREKI